ncbi:MAG: SPOR domain-containing protein, partial [Bdellovibrionales bacterium]|nr:SPOR domain-containing protein [Bdellovibrionales bacterium]
GAGNHSASQNHPLQDRPFEEIVSLENLCRKLIHHIDRNYIAIPSSSLYAQRLGRLMEPHEKVEERAFDFGVYLSPEVEVLSFPDGSIRLSSGLMDMFTDQELMWLLIEEQYHIMYGNARESLVTAYQKELGVREEDDLSPQQLATVLRAFASTPYSIPQVLAVDEASSQAMKRYSYDLDAAPSALFKLAVLGNNHTLTSKQPEAQKRAQKLLVKNLIDQDDQQRAPLETSESELSAMDTTSDVAMDMEQPIEEADSTIQIPPALIREQNWQLRTGWYIEAGNFEDRVAAETLGERFRSADLSYHVAQVTFNNQELYLSLLGPFFEYEVAQEVLNDLRDTGNLRRDVRVLHIGH